MISFKCPYCKIEVDAEESDAGEIADCPNCGREIRIPDAQKTAKYSNKKQFKLTKRYNPRSLPSNATTSENNDALCFWMGFFFSFFGVLIAAIIGKGRCVRKAFWGMFVSFLVGVLIVGLVVLISLPSIFERQREAQAAAEKRKSEADKEMRAWEAEQREMMRKWEADEIEEAKKRKKTDTELNMYDVARGVNMWIEKYRKAPDSYQQVCKSYYYEFNELTEQQDAKWFIEPNKQKDAWGRDYMLAIRKAEQDSYSLNVEYTLRSAGPDGIFKTDDDLLKKESQYVFGKR